MMGIAFSTKKALKAAIGSIFEPIETSMFGVEYDGDGNYTVVGPDPYKVRNYFATVTVKDGRIVKVT